MIMKKILFLVIAAVIICSCNAGASEEIPSFQGDLFFETNDPYPDFSVKDLSSEAYERYSDLDEYGRAGAALACIGPESFPQTERESLEEITPTGYQNAWYELVEYGYVYNRCHLIAYRLTGNNSVNNIITGTHCLNVKGMVPYEDLVALYILRTGNHVLYRVTPVYEGDNLVASAVRMEGYSVEDLGEGICFNVLVYNVQPGIRIDYASGETWQDESVVVTVNNMPAAEEKRDLKETGAEITYILNTNSMKFHRPSCDSVSDMWYKNKAEFNGTREEASEMGYVPCGICDP